MTGRRVVWASTSTSTKGGVAAAVRTLLATPLADRWDVRHVATHRDGSAVLRVLAFARGLLAFLGTVLRHRPDVVHLHTASYGSFARKATLLWTARALGAPVVLHVHGGGFEDFYRGSSRPVQRLVRATLARADTVLALGPGWAGRLRRIEPRARVAVLPNGVAVPTHPAGAAQTGAGVPLQVVFLGALTAAKGVPQLLEAWRSATAALEPGAARLVLAGSGDAVAVRADVERAGVAATVSVPGWLDPGEAGALLDRAQVLVLPSLAEGQPMAVLEAMARGLCVVATTVGGVPDLVVDGRDGVLVPPDDVDALAAALRRVLTDHRERARLGAAARERVRADFDAAVLWRRLDRLYQDLVADRARTTRTREALRVTYVVPDLAIGGAERHVTTLLPALDPARFRPSAVCLGAEGALFPALTAAGVPARALGRSRRQALGTLVDLVREFRRTRPDVVLTRGYNAEVLGRLAAVLAGVPHRAVWVHNCGDLHPRPRVRRVLDRLLDPVTDAYLAVAHGQVPYLVDDLGHPARKVRVVHNGADPALLDRTARAAVEGGGAALRASLGLRPDDPVIGVVAVLRPEKDHATLLRALRLVVDEVPAARLLVVGDGPLRAELTGLAADLGLADHVVFTGARRDVPALLRLMDVVTLSSVTVECFPMALLEAMAAERPAVCTAVGGLPEMVAEGVTGHLVPPRDPRALADRLVALLRDPATAAAMGRAGRARLVERFTLDRSVRRAEEVLDELAGRVRPAAPGSARDTEGVGVGA